MADGWDNDREQLLSREIQRGRRHLAILGVSLHTALRLPDDRDGKGQREALRNNTPALKTQPSWWSDEGIRHSRLLRIGDETPEQLVRRIMSNTLNELDFCTGICSCRDTAVINHRERRQSVRQRDTVDLAPVFGEQSHPATGDVSGRQRAADDRPLAGSADD